MRIFQTICKTRSWKYILGVGTALALSGLLYGLYLCAAPYEGLQETVFRLHILANSDDASDQQLKLAVRDDLLPAVKELFDSLDLSQYEGDTPAKQAANAAKDSIGLLSAIAQRSVYAHGSTQIAAVCVGYEAFEQKQYESITMPAGSYWCLRVILGSGQGKNWWCVLYPPLCITPAAAEECFDERELAVLYRPEHYRFRLAIVEWLHRWKKRN